MSESLSEPEFEPETPSQEIADTLGAVCGEEFGFDEETLGELASSPFEEAFETAYSYLTQAGLEPDVLLAPWMEKPESE